MKIRMLLGAFFTVILCVSVAEAESYVVKSGDTFSGIAKRHGVTVGKVAAVNPQVKNIHKIQPGWKLEIPTATSRSKNSIQVEVVGKDVGPLWSNPGGNKYQGSLEEGLRILGYSADLQKGFSQLVKDGEFQFGTIEHITRGGLVTAADGSKFRMVKMLSGTGQIITGPKGVIADWKDKGKMEAGKIYSFGNDALLIPLKCENPTLMVRVGTPSTEEIPPPTETSPSPGFTYVPPAFPGEQAEVAPFTYLAPPKKDWTIEHEPILGAFFMGNDFGDSKGVYGEYTGWLREGHCYIFENGWSPGVGIYGIYSEFDSKIGSYEGDEYSYGPQAGIKYIGYGANPWNFQLKGRFVWEQMSGSTDEGYAFDQEGTKAGVYSELTKQINKSWLVGIIGEAWWDIDSSRISTWSGDTPSERGMTSLDIFAQYRISEDWGVRASAGIFTQEWDDLTGMHARLEARYKNTLMFGPYAAWYPFGLSSVYDGVSASSLTTLGGFVRVEFGEIIRDYYAEKRMEKVKAADRQWLDDLVAKKFKE